MNEHAQLDRHLSAEAQQEAQWEAALEAHRENLRAESNIEEARDIVSALDAVGEQLTGDEA